MEATLQNGREERLVQKPIEGKWFRVTPTAIDQRIVKGNRNDPREETIRKTIVAAFLELRNYPERYAKPFETLMPEKNWQSGKVGGYKTGEDYERIANSYDGHMANWVEQALEWAQRITNGETWRELCVEPDVANWYRLIIGKDGNYRLVGDASKITRNYLAAAGIDELPLRPGTVIENCVPLVVRPIEKS